MEEGLYRIVKKMSMIEDYNRFEDYIEDIEKEYWNKVFYDVKTSNYMKLLYTQFYNNYVEVFKNLKISKFDMKKYEALTTIIKAIDNVKIDGLKIIEEELNEIKVEAIKLINKLKTKYSEILEVKFSKNYKMEKLLSKIEKIEDIYMDLNKEEKEIVLFIDFSNIDDKKLTEVIRKDLDFKKVKKLCRTKEEIKNVELLENRKEYIVNKIKLTGTKLNHSYRLFIRGFRGTNYKAHIDIKDFIKIFNKKKTKQMLPDEIISILELCDGDYKFNSNIYKYKTELIYILCNYLKIKYDTFNDNYEDIYEDDLYRITRDNYYPNICNESYDDQDPIGYKGTPDKRIIRR